MPPKLTPLQYLVLNLLFVGRQSGEDLRRELAGLGIRQSRAAFSRLMARMVEANYVDPQPGTRSVGGQTVRCCRYEVTDLGVLEWLATQKFYVNLAPPSPDLTPVVTQSGQLGDSTRGIVRGARTYSVTGGVIRRFQKRSERYTMLRWARVQFQALSRPALRQLCRFKPRRIGAKRQPPPKLAAAVER